jgi:hypothetical protein
MRVLGMILAGGEGGRLFPLTAERAKPAVPFAGKYRIIDFVLSNFINSGIYSLRVLTQFKAQSLVEHLQEGWQFVGILGDHFVIPVPAQMRRGRATRGELLCFARHEGGGPGRVVGLVRSPWENPASSARALLVLDTWAWSVEDGFRGWEVMTMRIVTHGVVAVLAVLIGLGVGYLLWGVRVSDLSSQLRQQRSEYDYRIAEQERRARAAEDRARQEIETRRALEEELQKVHPQK